VKQSLPLLWALIALSCSPGEKSSATNDTASADTLQLPTPSLTVSPITEAEPDTASIADQLLGVLNSEGMFQEQHPVAELATTSTIQLDNPGQPNKIQGIGIHYDDFVGEEQELSQVLMLAFFDTSGDKPEFVASLSLGEEPREAKFGAVELTPGLFAVSVLLSSDVTRYPASGAEVDESKDEVAYYAMNKGKVVQLFSYVPKFHSFQKSGAKEDILETNEESVIEFGELAEGQLPPIKVTTTGTTAENGEDAKSIEPRTVNYVFDPNKAIYKKE
jgi:hypothetical protein